MVEKSAPHGYANFITKREKQASNRRGACDPSDSFAEGNALDGASNCSLPRVLVVASCLWISSERRISAGVVSPTADEVNRHFAPLLSAR